MAIFMNLIPKVMLQIHQHHVIKILILSLLVSACSSFKKNVDNSNSYELINIQIELNLVNFEGESSLLSFDLNNYLDDYLKKIENDDFSAASLKNKIGISIFDEVFSTSEIKYLKDDKNQFDIDTSKLTSYKNVELILEDVQKENQDIDSQFKIHLSYPKITSNSKYGLIAYAFGFTYALEGGVNLYEYKNGKWRFLKTIDYWIE